MTKTTEVFSIPPAPVQRSVTISKASHAKKKSRTPNPYFLFCKARRTELTALQPDITSRDLTKLLAAEWRLMSNEQRAVYSNEYAAIRAQSDKDKEDTNLSDPGKGLPIWLEIPTPLGEVITVAGYYQKPIE